VWFRKNKANHDLFDDSRRDQCLKYKHKQPPQIPAETEIFYHEGHKVHKENIRFMTFRSVPCLARTTGKV
ncbi:MAG: hypothetical protein LBI05_06765, partial [Planctomycetaceae bacterium]|nr:hypothetical protein [Planctomycetaceae bacterium]